jgi:hypothetical protein
VAAFTLTKTTKDNNSRTTEAFPKSFFIPGIPLLQNIFQQFIQFLFSYALSKPIFIKELKPGD